MLEAYLEVVVPCFLPRRDFRTLVINLFTAHVLSSWSERRRWFGLWSTFRLYGSQDVLHRLAVPLKYGGWAPILKNAA